MKHHELKTWSHSFELISDGSKKFEICKNDRDFKEGDKVCFRPESEYEFKIDDKTLYRMKSKNITMML